MKTNAANCQTTPKYSQNHLQVKQLHFFHFYFHPIFCQEFLKILRQLLPHVHQHAGAISLMTETH